MNSNRTFGIMLMVLSAFLPATVALAGDLTLGWYTIDGGGALFTTDGQPAGLELSGTIGQADVDAVMTGGSLEVTGGFWVGVQAFCFGDLDGDGQIGLSDLATLIANYEEPGPWGYEDGDLDGDGDVDLSDLAALLGEYGSTCP